MSIAGTILKELGKQAARTAVEEITIKLVKMAFESLGNKTRKR